MTNHGKNPEQYKKTAYEQEDQEIKKIKNEIKNLQNFANLDANKLIEYAKSDKISGDISKTQIRRIFSAVKKIQMEVRRESFDKQKDKIILLKPKLAYAAKKKNEVKHLAEILSECIDTIKNKDDFERFVDFFEAIIAYHGE